MEEILLYRFLEMELPGQMYMTSRRLYQFTLLAINVWKFLFVISSPTLDNIVFNICYADWQKNSMLKSVFFWLLSDYLFAFLLAIHVIWLWFNQFSIGGHFV